MSRRHHILFISSWYPNRNNTTHGLFNKVFAEAAALHNKVSVLHICSEDNLDQETELTEEKKGELYSCIVYYKKVKNKIPFLSQWTKRRRFIAAFEAGYQRLIIKEGKPDLIQLNVTMPAGIGVLHLSEKYNIPFIVNEGWSGYYPEDGNYNGFFLKYFTKKILSRAKKILPVSQRLQTAIQDHGLRGNYTVVPNAINEALFRPLTSPGHDGTKFLHISSLNDREKNVSGIIRAFAEAKKINPQMELNIVGDGEDIAGLRTLVTKLNISDSILFKGRLMGETLVKELNENDALVMFSHYETFGITVIEALACGKPVISARSGGVGDLITPDLGILIERNDEPALCDAFLQIAKTKNSFDSLHIRKFVTDRYTVTRVGAQLTEIYNSVLA